MLEHWFGSLSLWLWGPDLLRLSLGPTMIVRGYPKLFGSQPGPAGFSQYLQKMGFGRPLFWAYVVGCAEFFGGICLLLGFLTRPAAFALVIEFAIIIFGIKWAKGIELAKRGWAAEEIAGLIDAAKTWAKGFEQVKGGWEWEWALLMMLISLFVTGPGRFALDHRIPTGL